MQDSIDRLNSILEVFSTLKCKIVQKQSGLSLEYFHKEEDARCYGHTMQIYFGMFLFKNQAQDSMDTELISFWNTIVQRVRHKITWTHLNDSSE